jgi:hypothetical protein
MVIFENLGYDDMDFRYDAVDEGDLLTAVSLIEMFLQSVGQRNIKKVLPKKG